MDQEIILTYTLKKRDDINHNSMLDLIQYTPSQESSESKVQKCYDILVKEGEFNEQNNKFYVNNNSMVGHILKSLVKKQKFDMKCRKANEVETQTLPESNQNIKVIDSFKNAVLYSQLKFIGEGENGMTI